MTPADAPETTLSCTAVILAAGEGTRMRSARPKVLHPVAGLSMVGHVAAAAKQAGADRIAVVVGPGRDDVAAEVRRLDPSAQVFVQTERRGTAHALLAARDLLVGAEGPILVLFGDTPLLQPDTLAAMRDAVSTGAAVAALGFEARDARAQGEPTHAERAREVSLSREITARRVVTAQDRLANPAGDFFDGAWTGGIHGGVTTG